MPKEYEKGTFGQWLQLRLKVLYSNLRAVRFPESKNIKKEDVPTWENVAAVTYSQIDRIQQYMLDHNLSLTDRMPDKETVRGLYEAAGKQAEDPEFKEPFSSKNIDNTMSRLKMDEQDPPEPEEMVQAISSIRAAQERERPQQEQQLQEKEQQLEERREKQAEQREQRWEKRSEKYPVGSYGDRMQRAANELQQYVQWLQDMANDPVSKEAFEKYKKEPSKVRPEFVTVGIRFQDSAAGKIAEMRLLQEMMNREGKGLNDATPPSAGRGDWQDNLSNEAFSEGQKPINTRLFTMENINNTAKYFNMEKPELPTLKDVLLPYGKLLNERNTTIETAKAAQEEAKVKAAAEREALKDPARKLLERLKETTQKSFTGRLKSFFVGNSKEYDTAVKAIQGLADGTGDPKKAKAAIESYLDLRGNKVRDHAYGRERFDAMLSGLEMISTPKEFVDACAKIDNARDQRTNGSYSLKGGKIDASKYMSAERFAEAREEIRRQDIEALEADENLGMQDKRGFTVFFDDLKKLKDEKGWNVKKREELSDFMQKHPSVRDAAREIAEKNHLKIKIPETPGDLDQKHAEMLSDQERNARTCAFLPQKTQEKQGGSREF